MNDRPTSSGKVSARHLNTTDFDQAIKDAGMPVFIDFYAEWCGPCKAAAPIVEKLAAEYAGKVLVVKVDTDPNQALAQRFDVRSIPTALILKQDGEKVLELDRLIGFAGEGKYRQMLEKVAPKETAKAA